MTQARAESFVPLTAVPASPERREFRVTVINAAKNAGSFHTLDAPAAANGKKSCEPRVTVQRDGGRITQLRVQCSCGQVLDLACVYDAPPPTV
jgi:hypothetical protein